MMIMRAAAIATGDFDEELRQAEDLDWLQRATENGVGVVTINRALMDRRIHHTNLTQDAAAGRSAMFLMLKKQIERNRSRGPSSSA